MDVGPSTVSTFKIGEREFSNVRIRELGAFSVPEVLLRDGPVFQRVLDVVDISVSGEPGVYVLEPKGSIVTTELLSPRVRLEIVPKFGFDGLAVLLALASSSVETLAQAAPVNVEEGQGLVEVFARRFLSTLPAVLSAGWIPMIERERLLAADVRGDVNLVGSYERILSGQLEFEQQVNRLHWSHPGNRVVLSTLRYLYALRALLPPDVTTEVQEALAGAPGIEPFAEGPRHALAWCERILSSKLIDASRSYFYPACETARPILQALGRALGGVPQVEDVPFRIHMPSTVESAVRNVTSRALGATFTALKEDRIGLYERSDPSSFTPLLVPDIVIRPLADLRRCVAVLDVKYKERPTASDHYQLAAYARSYGSLRSAFVTVTDDPGDGGRVAEATMADGAQVFEYAIPAHAIRDGMRRYVTWVRALCAS